MEGELLLFFIANETDSEKENDLFELSEYDTVGTFKYEVHKRFNILPHRQVIEGWANLPEDDSTILRLCSNGDITRLTIRELGNDNNFCSSHSLHENQNLEVEAANHFIREISNNLPDNSIKFHSGSLKDMITKVHPTPLKEQKVILLYLHNQNDQLANIFWRNLKRSEVVSIVNRSFLMLGWNIEQTKYHGALNMALNEHDLCTATTLINKKIGAVLCIVPISGILSIYSCIRGKYSDSDFLMALKTAEDFVKKQKQEVKLNELDFEVEAVNDFMREVSNNLPDNFIKFHSGTLKDMITEAHSTPLKERKVILLSLHNQNDQFANIFWRNLKRPDVLNIVNRSFLMLGWNIEQTKYHGALNMALNEHDLCTATTLVNNKVGAALCIVPISGSLIIYSCMRGKYSDKDFLLVLKTAEEFLKKETQEEVKLKELEDKSNIENIMGSKNIQKLMADMLGDRDYDSFEHDEHKYLKQKIAYAFKGAPQSEDGYDEKLKQSVQKLYEKILENSNTVSQYRDKVEVAFIYNCTEPLPSEKLKRAEKYGYTYQPDLDVTPVPIFVLRKCHGSDKPCRIFIDDMGRVYQSWQDYISENKLRECKMVLPRDGRYNVNKDGEVFLEEHLSPSCSVGVKVLQGLDIASAVGGIASGGIFVAAAIPTIAVAPIALIGGAVVGAGIGIYSIVRSSITLHDRRIHQETMSFVNSKARGAYLNIIAGSLGFVGAGANMVVSQLVSQGVNIGKGAGAVVNTIGIANIGAGGASLVNSSYDVIDQWINDNQTPSLLTIVQLSSSILFFGHAVYNFKTCSTIVEETQARTLRDFQESLRSNRHRKTFTKLMKETIRLNKEDSVKGRAEVISTIRNIHNKDEVFAVLTRSNSKMNKNGVKFSANGGQIQLNGITINMNEFLAMNNNEIGEFLSNLPLQSEVTTTDTFSMRSIFNTSNLSMPSLDIVVTYAANCLRCFNGDTKDLIIKVVVELLTLLAIPFKKELDEIFPNHLKYINLINMVVTFFSKLTKGLEEQHNLWKSTNDDKYYNPIFSHINFQKVISFISLAQEIIAFYHSGKNLIEPIMRKLITFFYNWFAKKVYDYQENAERVKKRLVHSAKFSKKKVSCCNCGGYYYQNV